MPCHAMAACLQISARPTEGLLLGSLMLVFALSCLPLAMHCYSGNQVNQPDKYADELIIKQHARLSPVTWPRITWLQNEKCTNVITW